MSEHADVNSFINTRGIISGAVATLLFLLSSAAIAAKTGPACVVPSSGGLSAAQWAAAQDAATTKGHLVACHIGKDTTWLKDRTEGKKAPKCTKQNIASTWSSADEMWKAVATDVDTFCKAAEVSGEVKHAIQRPIGGTGANVVGSGYNASTGAFTIKDNQQSVLVFVKDASKGWYVLTGYPK